MLYEGLGFQSSNSIWTNSISCYHPLPFLHNPYHLPLGPALSYRFYNFFNYITIYLIAHLETSCTPYSPIILTKSHRGHSLLKCTGPLLHHCLSPPYTHVSLLGCITIWKGAMASHDLAVLFSDYHLYQTFFINISHFTVMQSEQQNMIRHTKELSSSEAKRSIMTYFIRSKSAQVVYILVSPISTSQ